MRDPGSGIRDPITAAFRAYADRGVFRGFRATPAARGRIDYQFLWLTRRPMTATCDPRRRTLSFPSLLPDLDAGAAREVKALVAARTDRAQPVHKRLDARRARITGAVRKGGFSLTVEIRGDNHDYAVKKALNLINELFVALHEAHPAYLVEAVGLSTE
jgi:hypothetical protein